MDLCARGGDSLGTANGRIPKGPSSWGTTTQDDLGSGTRHTGGMGNNESGIGLGSSTLH